jgi:hypothetical protein
VLLLPVAADTLGHVGRCLLEVADDALVGELVVDQGALEVLREEVADDAKRKLRLLVDERRLLGGLGALFDRLPEALQEVEIALDVFRGRAFGRSTHDQLSFLRGDLLQDRAEAGALVVVQTTRDAEAFAARDIDDESAGQRDLRGETRALGLHRILHHLDEHRLTALDQILDLAAVPPALELGQHDLVDVKEAVLLQTDLDERRLHARENVVDRAEVDVAGDRAALGALEVHLCYALVLEDGDPLLSDADRDKEVALRRGKRHPAGRGPAAGGGPAAVGRSTTLLGGLALPLRGRLALPLRGRLAPLRGRRTLALRGRRTLALRRGGGFRLAGLASLFGLAPLATASSAPTSPLLRRTRLIGFGRRLRGRLSFSLFCLLGLRRRFGGSLGLLLLLASKPQ